MNRKTKLIQRTDLHLRHGFTALLATPILGGSFKRRGLLRNPHQRASVTRGTNCELTDRGPLS
ncbi:hypothetical protein C5167_030759 [Papaver somniferum]|nr:hypothetical protein C5167_030759 [Papaver somniferum]